MFFAGASARAEDGYRLWLRYDPLPERMIAIYRPRVTAIVAPGDSATLRAVREELVNGCAGLLGGSIAATETVDRAGAVVVGTPKNSPVIARLNLPLAELGAEGFRIRSVYIGGRAVTVIASDGEIGSMARFISCVCFKHNNPSTI